MRSTNFFGQNLLGAALQVLSSARKILEEEQIAPHVQL